MSMAGELPAGVCAQAAAADYAATPSFCPNPCTT
jgi:hypothetical protein